MITSKRLVVLAGATLFAASAFAQTSPGTVTAASSLPATISYVSLDGLIVVKTAVGTGAAQDAVIATGLPLSIISTDLAIRQSIQGQGVVDLATMQGVARVQSGSSQMFTIGNVPVNNVPVGIFDLYLHLSARAATSSPTIWLGWSALGSLNLTIDPEKHQIILQSASAPIPKKSIVAPFTIQDGRIYVQAKLNGHRAVRMLVDTASVGTLIPADAARALRLPEVATLPIKAASGRESRVTAVTLNELSIAGTVKIKDVRALYVSAGDTPDLGPDTGILGTDALLKHRVTINYGRNTIAFEKIEPKKNMVQSPPAVAPVQNPVVNNQPPLSQAPPLVRPSP